MTMTLTMEEGLFFDAHPALLPLYALLRAELLARHPEMTMEVRRTQISLRNGFIFAMASLPGRKLAGFGREYLLVSFGLGERRDSPRIAASVEAAPGRWTHHVPIASAGEVDAELLGWLEEAWQFCARKRRGKAGR